MDKLLLAGDVSLCIVATNDKSSGLLLRSISHLYTNNIIVGIPLGEPDGDYVVGDLVFYMAKRKPDGRLHEVLAKVDSNCSPVLDRLTVIVANLIRQDMDFRHAPLGLAVLTDAGWARRLVNLGPHAKETIEVDKVARGIGVTLSNISNGIVSSSYSTPEELHDQMIYDGVVVLGVIAANNNKDGVVISLVSHQFSDDQVCTRRFADCYDPNLAIGDLVFHTMSPVDQTIRETIITVDTPRERTSVDPPQYVAITNVWSQFSLLLDRIKGFFALFIERNIDLRKLGFDRAQLNSTGPLRISSWSDLKGIGEA